MFLLILILLLICIIISVSVEYGQPYVTSHAEVRGQLGGVSAVGSRDWTQVFRLMQQTFLPSEPWTVVLASSLGTQAYSSHGDQSDLPTADILAIIHLFTLCQGITFTVLFKSCGSGSVAEWMLASRCKSLGFISSTAKVKSTFFTLYPELNYFSFWKKEKQTSKQSKKS